MMFQTLRVFLMVPLVIAVATAHIVTQAHKEKSLTICLNSVMNLRTFLCNPIVEEDVFSSYLGLPSRYQEENGNVPYMPDILHSSRKEQDLKQNIISCCRKPCTYAEVLHTC